MKKLLPLLALALLCGFTFGTRVDWTWHGKSILIVRDGAATLELGLSSDGTVIWREITASTNSPAEDLIKGTLFYATNALQVTPMPEWTPPQTQFLYTFTNIVTTNRIPIQ